MKALFKLNQDEDIAEAQSAELGRLAQVLSDASWALDAALSAKRKDAAGYRRANKANPDGGDNFDPADLAEAIANARSILASCNGLQDWIERRRRAEESRSRTELACDPLSYVDGAGTEAHQPRGLGFLRTLIGDKRSWRGFA